MMTCAQCTRPFDDNSGFGLEDWSTTNTRFALCSLACLCEFAWTLREKLPKLSKSRS